MWRIVAGLAGPRAVEVCKARGHEALQSPGGPAGTVFMCLHVCAWEMFVRGPGAEASR